MICCQTCKESSKVGSIFHDSSNVERCEALGTWDACQQIHPHATRPFQHHLYLHIPRVSQL